MSSAPLEVTDLKSRLSDGAVLNLLSYSTFPDPERLEKVRRQYLSQEDWALLGIERGDTLLGCIGTGRLTTHGVIRHIGVLTSERSQGTGRILIAESMRRLNLTSREAETDASAVGFYDRCGFTVYPLGEKYPGVERFRCVLG